MVRRKLRIAALTGLYGSLASPAYAYLDAATGSIIIQAIIGAVGTWIVYSKLLVQRVRGFFGAKPAGNPEASDDK